MVNGISNDNGYNFDINKFKVNLSKLRKKHDMTQSELADKLNLTRQAISRYENGDSFPDITILLSICEVFNVSIDYLIGIKTNGEKIIINQVLKEEEVQLGNDATMDDLINLAPILKPSVLNKAIMGFKHEGINIESIAKLVEFLNDKSLYHLLTNTNYTTPSSEVLKFLLPYMDDDSKWAVFAKILEGKVDYHFLEEFIPAVKWIDISLIEAAVVEGVLDYDALSIMREGVRRRYMNDERSFLRI